MRILILGGDGMLGHRLLRHLAPHHEVRVTLHQRLEDYGAFGLFNRANAHAGVDARDASRVIEVFSDFKPQAVVNAIGIVKQRPGVKDGVLSVEVNGMLPHLLARLCRAHGAQLVHLSTDCVFSGKKGNYTEGDRPDPEDVYGFSKLIGEAAGRGALTLRTSMIGQELKRKTSLVEWFLSQRGKSVKGWRKAIFSGFTTAEMSRLIETIVTRHPGAHGTYHVSAEPISKFDLLSGIETRIRSGTAIAPDDSVHCDRSLDSTRFRSEFGYAPPAWGTMLDELAADIVKDAR